MRIKVGDLVELNAAGKKRLWLSQAVDAVGILMSVKENQGQYDWRCGGASVAWMSLKPKLYWWDRELDEKIIPINCLKKVRKSKKSKK